MHRSLLRQAELFDLDKDVITSDLKDPDIAPAFARPKTGHLADRAGTARGRTIAQFDEKDCGSGHVPVTRARPDVSITLGGSFASPSVTANAQ